MIICLAFIFPLHLILLSSSRLVLHLGKFGLVHDITSLKLMSTQLPMPTRFYKGIYQGFLGGKQKEPNLIPLLGSSGVCFAWKRGFGDAWKYFDKPNVVPTLDNKIDGFKKCIQSPCNKSKDVTICSKNRWFQEAYSESL